MAKGFPYFKFVATEWLTGDIVFEDFDVQGLFINICATYWHRNGQLTVEDINKRFKCPELLSKLIPTFITHTDGVVSISFLDEQLREANHISKINSLNGSGGGRPIKTSEKNLAIFYLLKCKLGDEEFYKAGITSESISRRFSNTTGGNRKIPYYFDVIFSVELNQFVALSLENDIRQKFERYTPKIKFSGHNECYIISDKLLKHIEKYMATTETKATKTEPKAKKSKEEEEKELEEDKNKEEDTHTVFAKKLLQNQLEVEAIESSTRKRVTEQILKEFNAHLITESKHHSHYSQWMSHLRNWLNKKPESTKEILPPSRKTRLT